MSRNLALYLDDILTSIAKIERYTANMTREAFVTDERTFDAVAHNLQVIGEAVKNIPNRQWLILDCYGLTTSQSQCSR